MSKLGPLNEYDPISDWTPYLRDYKISLITGETEIKISKKALSEFDKVLKFVKDTFPNDVITGSLALNLLGLIDRDIKDVDILIEDVDRYEGYYISSLYGYDSRDNYNNRLGYKRFKHRYGFWNSIFPKEYMVDFFENKKLSDVFTFEYDNHTYSLEHPIDIIEHKININDRKSYYDLYQIFIRNNYEVSEV